MIWAFLKNKQVEQLDTADSIHVFAHNGFVQTSSQAFSQAFVFCFKTPHFPMFSGS
jgi:hypothetical protein